VQSLPGAMTSLDNKQRQFDLLYELLVDIQDRVVSGNEKVAAMLIVAIGFLATKDASSLLKSTPYARFIAITAIATTFVLYASATFQAWWISRKTLKRMHDLNVMPTESYGDRRTHLSTMVIFVLGNGTLACLTIALIRFL
jgi:hypothetical protein